MRLFLAAFAMMAMMTGFAHAQKGMGGGGGEVNPANKDPFKLMLEREQQARDENERAYNAQMKRLKGQGAAPTNSDPWKIVRPTGEPAAKR
jgi:hypothetical protein